MDSVLSAQGLVKRFGNREVVRGVSLSVSQAQVMGILGPNGAGKTTTFSMLTGVLKPTAGTVSLDNTDITKLPLHERARLGIGYLPQETSVFKKLTVRANLDIVLQYSGLPRAEQRQRAEELLSDFGLTRLAGQKAALLSGGERRRLEIARALTLRPRFLLLDEPFAGIDPLAVLDLQSIIGLLRDRGIGVLVSDHNVREALCVCDQAALVYDGQIMMTGTPDELVNDPRAREVYLGEGFCLLPR